MLLTIITLATMTPLATTPLSVSDAEDTALQQQGRGWQRGAWRERRATAGPRRERPGGTDQAALRGAQRISYGSSEAQRVLLWRAPAGQARPPLAVYVHGGGWQNGEPEMVAEKPAFFAQHGWAFASIGYRLLPEAPVEEQAADVGRALRALREQAARGGYDPDRILLFGHSAGAHLAALVASDPQYAGDAFAAIRGVIPVDGACYDVPAQMAAGGFMVERTYVPAFGRDPARQRALSPITHAGGRDVADWLLLYTSARDDAAAQSRALGAAIERGGAQVQLVEVPARSRNALAAHREINVDFGTANYAANPAILAMMARIERRQ